MKAKKVEPTSKRKKLRLQHTVAPISTENQIGSFRSEGIQIATLECHAMLGVK